MATSNQAQQTASAPSSDDPRAVGSPAEEVGKPGPAGGLEFVHEAKTLLVENLVLLMGNPSFGHSIDHYLDALQALQVKTGPKTLLDFSDRSLTLAESNSNWSLVSIAQRLLSVSVTIATADQRQSNGASKDLAQIQTACAPKVNELLKAMRGGDGTPFGLAADEARATRLKEIEEALGSPPEAGSTLEQVAREYRQAMAADSQGSAKVAPELAFISKYLDARRQFHKDTNFTENLWQFFGHLLDSALQIPARQERGEKISSIVKSICNIVAKEYLIKRRQAHSSGLFLQTDPQQLETIAKLVTAPFEHYLLARARSGTKVATLHAQLVTAADSLNINEDLSSLLSGSSVFKTSLLLQLRTIDLSTEAQARFGTQAQQGLLGSQTTQGMFLIAATPAGAQVPLADGTRSLRLGVSSSVASGSGVSESAGSQSGAAAAETRRSTLQSVFTSERGFPPHYQILEVLSNTIREAKQPADLVTRAPSIISEAFERLLGQSGPAQSNQASKEQESGTILHWTEHMMALYERSAEYAPKGSKSVRDAWETLTRKTPELSKTTIQELNAARQAVTGSEATPITAEDVAKGYFLGYLLRGCVVGASDSKTLDREVREALEKLYAATQDIAYAMALTHLASLAATKLETSPPSTTTEAPTAPAREKPRGFSWMRRPTSDAKTETAQSATEEPEQPIHQGLSFEDLRTRVESIGQKTYDELPSLGFEQQIARLQMLMTGTPNAAQLAKLVQRVSPYTHPDSRAVHFPQESLHSALEGIFRGVATLVKGIESSASYEEQEAETALLQILQGFSELKKKQQQLVLESQQRAAESQRVALETLPQILEVLTELRRDVAAIKASLAKTDPTSRADQNTQSSD
jgi:hypothetical protein